MVRQRWSCVSEGLVVSTRVSLGGVRGGARDGVRWE